MLISRTNDWRTQVSACNLHKKPKTNCVDFQFLFLLLSNFEKFDASEYREQLKFTNCMLPAPSFFQSVCCPVIIPTVKTTCCLCL